MILAVKRRLILFFIAILYELSTVYADQPIMNMMPRWDGGYGFQVLTEHIHNSDLKKGDKTIRSDYSEDITKLHLQAVYTWNRSTRMTFKLPYITNARRENIAPSGQREIQSYEGLGDITLALPLKKYFNLATRSGSWTLAPQIRIPSGEKANSYQVPDCSWGTGLSVGYETETYNWFFATNANAWIYKDELPAEYASNLDLGWKIKDSILLLIETDLDWDDNGAISLFCGPALYWRLSHRIHSRIEWKNEFVSIVSKEVPDHGNGKRFSIGIGFVY